MNPLHLARDRLKKASGIAVAFPEGTDGRIQQAAIRIRQQERGIRPVLLGPEHEIGPALAHDSRGIDIVDPQSCAFMEEFASAYASARPDTPAAIANRLIKKPMYLAGMMLRQGRVQAMVAGVTSPTARVIEAAMLTVGLQPGVSAPSSFFVMQLGDRTLVFADCAVNVTPDTETLAAIGVASAQSCEALLDVPPRVAFLSFSTHGSANHDLARKVRDAAARARELCPKFEFDGELQADAALVPRVADLKVKGPSHVAGQANVLVFPDLNAANIGYKLVQHLGGAKALGPFLQGFAAPVSDLSRGATVDDIVETTILTASRAVG